MEAGQGAEDAGGRTQAAGPGYWHAPTARGPVNATVVLPGSKSQTSRALVIGTIAAKPTLISGVLASRDSYLAARAMEALGARIEFLDNSDLVVHPPKVLQGGSTIDCGQAGTVMRFGSALAAFADGKTTLVGDPSASNRPLAPLMDSLVALGASVKYGGRPGYLPVTIKGVAARKKKAESRLSREDTVRVDTSSSSQYLSALLLASPLISERISLRAEGRVPSWPYVAMSLDMLADQGVDIQRTSAWSWLTDPTRPAGHPIAIEPDLSNAGPFLAAALIAGGQVTIPHWPVETDQVGKYWLEILPLFGATVTQTAEGLTVSAPGGTRWPGLEYDLGACGELAPTVAALCLFATSPSTLIGIGHLRGHETDRLDAMAQEIERLGGSAHVLHDGIRIKPAPLHAANLRSYEDHRMATFGAIVGLAVPGCTVENIATTAKTLPNFPGRWDAMLTGAQSPPTLNMADVFADPTILEDTE